ncbi:MAG: FAD-dependent oxidoreductase, partial [Pyrinomonadaceae bacterium]
MNLNRRELLTLFLGAPLAAAACRENTRLNFPDGEIVGQSADLGHVLREGRMFEVASDKWETRKVAIIGGGIAGLSAAWKLEKENFNDFILLELERDVGGTSMSGSGEPVGYPWGAHYLPVPFKENVELISLLDEMSLTEGRDGNGEPLIKEQFLCREPEERVFYKGRWYEGLYLHAGASEDDKRQFAEFQKRIDDWVNWRDAKGKRAFAVPLASCSGDAEITGLDNITFADWLQQNGFTSERLYWICDYATRDDYGLKADQASAWVGLFYFCSRVRKSGVESQPFITCPEGNGQFVNHFVEKVKDNVCRSQMVVSVMPVDTGVDVIYLDGGELRGLHCRKVIYASPM